MGVDAGRAATGISYLMETLQVQETQYEAEADARRKPARGLALAQGLLQVGRHHHQQSDPREAIEHYERAQRLVEEAIEQRQSQDTDAAKRSIGYARFMLSE